MRAAAVIEPAGWHRTAASVLRAVVFVTSLATANLTPGARSRGPYPWREVRINLRTASRR
jgi:hypothetical protein